MWCSRPFSLRVDIIKYISYEIQTLFKLQYDNNTDRFMMIKLLVKLKVVESEPTAVRSYDY